MPKIGMQPIRSSALIDAVIAEIGQSGTMDVTVSQIAKRADMSTALAHHYFGSKNSMFVAAMRHILKLFGAEIRQNLDGETDPLKRLEIIIQTSFSNANMHHETVAAWLNFYVFAQKSDDVARLLKVYHTRLQQPLPKASQQSSTDPTSAGCYATAMMRQSTLNKRHWITFT